MRVLIVDDEPLARRRLWRLLERLPDVEIVGEAEHGAQALSLIATHKPELLLLDIDMPVLDGVALAKQLTDSIAIIFTTAHREHAVEAFALDAADYLLKPYDEARLAAALDRVRARLGASIVEAPAVRTLPLRLPARSSGSVELLDPRLISRLFASDKYTLCHVAGREYVLDESLNELETKLAPLGFLRVHRKELVNLSKVRSLNLRSERPELMLEDGQRALVSRRSLSELKAKLGLS